MKQQTIHRIIGLILLAIFVSVIVSDVFPVSQEQTEIMVEWEETDTDESADENPLEKALVTPFRSLFLDQPISSGNSIQLLPASEAHLKVVDLPPRIG